jgi:cytochrome P450
VPCRVAQQIIAGRFSATEEKPRHDMVTSFKNHGLSQLEISDESLFQLLAGSDTTATIVRTGFLSILSNPHIYRKLQDEAISANVPLDTIIPYSQALRLPYLQACIKEALRHHPAAAGLLPRVVGANGDTHKGVYLPPGTEVAFCAWNMHRHNTAVYGADAEIFRPERWLEASPERLAVMEEAHHLVFGNGRFRCMGENIARLELNKIFFEMIRRFDWSLVDPVGPIAKNTNYGLFVQKGMFVRVSELEG